MKAPNHFVEAVLNANFKLANELLSSGMDINSRYGDSGWTALHFSVEELSLQPTAWLLENGADPNRQDSSGWTPLHLLVDSESDFANQERTAVGDNPTSTKLVALLLQHGADPNARANDGTTPLSIAQCYRNSAAIEILKRQSDPGTGNG